MQHVGERAKTPFSCLTHLGTPDPIICVWVPLDSGICSCFIGLFPPFFLPSHWGRPGSRFFFLTLLPFSSVQVVFFMGL